MSPSDADTAQPGERSGLSKERRDDGDIILRLKPATWVVAAVAFSIGALVGVLLD